MNNDARQINVVVFVPKDDARRQALIDTIQYELDQAVIGDDDQVFSVDMLHEHLRRAKDRGKDVSDLFRLYGAE